MFTALWIGNVPEAHQRQAAVPRETLLLSFPPPSSLPLPVHLMFPVEPKKANGRPHCGTATPTVPATTRLRPGPPWRFRAPHIILHIPTHLTSLPTEASEPLHKPPRLHLHPARPLSSPPYLQFACRYQRFREATHKLCHLPHHLPMPTAATSSATSAEAVKHTSNTSLGAHSITWCSWMAADSTATARQQLRPSE